MNTRALSTVHAPKLVIDAALYPRLVALAEHARARMPEVADRLLEEIERAELRPADKIPADVVTLGSEVTYRYDERVETVRIVAPSEADLARLHISVLTPVGAALLGLRAGQRIAWEMPHGHSKVLEVIAVRPPNAATGAKLAPANREHRPAS